MLKWDPTDLLIVAVAATPRHPEAVVVMGEAVVVVTTLRHTHVQLARLVRIQTAKHIILSAQQVPRAFILTVTSQILSAQQVPQEHIQTA